MKKIKVIGIDIDTHALWLRKVIREKSKGIGRIILEQRTKRGYHFRIELTNRVTLRRSFELRFWLHDDPRRILFDIIRSWHGFTNIDVLFSKKWRGWT